MTDTQIILEEISNNYSVENDYDSINTRLAFKIFKNDIKRKNVLEIGSADGYMSKMIIEYCNSLDILEPSSNYCSIIKNQNINVKDIYNCFIEDLDKSLKYDVIIIAGLLHHIENPTIFLNLLKNHLNRNGIVLATVPNVESLHRRIGVKMGILKNEFDSSLRNIQFNQYGKFNLKYFKELFINCEYNIKESYGYMIKPFSSEIMEKLNLNDEQINAMFTIGKEFQEICSQLYIKATIND